MKENLKVKICDLKDLHYNTKRALKKLTLYQNQESRMFNLLTEKWGDKFIQRVAIGYLDNKIVGWASAEGHKTHNNYWICCFVRPEYRRKGIGSTLCKILIDRKKHAFGTAHSIVSGMLWKSIRKKNKDFDIVYM